MKRTIFSITILLATVCISAIQPAGAVSDGPGATCATAGRTTAGTYTFSISSGSHFFRVPTVGFVAAAFKPHDPAADLEVAIHPPTCGPATCSSAGGVGDPGVCFQPAPVGITFLVVEIIYEGGPATAYDLTIVAPHPVFPDVVVEPFSTNRCILYNDENANGNPAAHEVILQVPCKVPRVPDPKVHECSIYDDVNGNNIIDPGETVLATRCPPGVGVVNNGDGTCTVYVDNNNSSTLDVGDTPVTHACPSPPNVSVYEDTANERHVVYDDRNDNDQPDSGETVYAIIEEYP